MKKIIIGSRGSELALCQANYVKNEIEKHHNRNGKQTVEVGISIIQTKGDRILDSALSSIGDKGLFTKEIEDKLFSGEIDVAVHSLKDIQTELDERFRIAAVTARGDAEDVLIARKKDINIFDLEENAVVATGSLRRSAQLLHLRPDIRIAELRGNVNTRIDKFLASDWSAIILAKAGVVRLGLQKYISSTIGISEMLPAAGQGALGIEIRESDAEMQQIIDPLNDADTYAAVSAERSFLKCLNGGCQVPIGAHAVVKSTGLYLDGVVASLDGSISFRRRIRGSRTMPEKLGEDLARDMLNAGAGEVLDEIRKG